MDIVLWVIWILVALAVLYQLFKGVNSFFGLWAAEGGLFALLTAIFFVLLIAPSLVKMFAPNYFGYSIWALIIYTVVLIGYRFTFRKESSE